MRKSKNCKTENVTVEKLQVEAPKKRKIETIEKLKIEELKNRQS
mgnify:CR=1 FL=1